MYTWYTFLSYCLSFNFRLPCRFFESHESELVPFDRLHIRVFECVAAHHSVFQALGRESHKRKHIFVSAETTAIKYSLMSGKRLQ